MKRYCALSMAIIMAGCSTAPSGISTSYVSPLQYQSYDCGQLSEEMHRITVRAHEVSGAQQSEATNDAVAVGVGIFFLPALLLLGGGDRAAELARLKGELEATEKVAIQKKCSSLLNEIEAGRKAATKQKSTS